MEESSKSRNTDDAPKGRVCFLPIACDKSNSFCHKRSQKIKDEIWAQQTCAMLSPSKEACLPPDTQWRPETKGWSSDLVRGSECVFHLVRISRLHVGFKVHQAAGLRLQEVCYPLGRSLATVSALDLQAVHSARGGDKGQVWLWQPGHPATSRTDPKVCTTLWRRRSSFITRRRHFSLALTLNHVETQTKTEFQSLLSPLFLIKKKTILG